MTENNIELLTLPEVAQVLRIRVAQVLRLEHEKRLHVVRFSRRVARVRRSDLDAFLAGQ
jgi:excisionase family DNA binding protein